jgi:hypothetical protein
MWQMWKIRNVLRPCPVHVQNISRARSRATSRSQWEFGASHFRIYRQIEALFAFGGGERRARAAGSANAKLKALFLQGAAQYRDLALQIDDPAA